MKFNNKTVIVTGAAGGIGLAIAKKFAAEGANLVLADINMDQLQTAGRQIASPNGVIPLLSQCDVSEEEQAVATVTNAMQHFGSLDVIINNAGLMIFKKLEEHTTEDWMRILSVDLMGAFYFIKGAFLHMKNGGAIINISSIHALETTPMVATYAAAKAALLSLTRSAAIEGKEKGIRVNAILPGAIDTPMLWQNPNIKAGLEQVSKDSVGKPEDIADVAAFLASDEAAFVQGAMAEVDGGRLNRL
ncbi:MAG: NAD(P)-dependent dehydrogenase, short-chain alcohol dehydrogenase family [Ferruginibacter sp.]|uniref:SDR family NAD(P)-dependent oxidoreductase n=1 Tax=Ferruginibacter sp. TaxID=1940288 RepID=UPI00265AFFEC|nr:SDR family NAD(P)-dependent oxidoreductase [Ferruginibacter sp.]MDB5279596.1 NAD(P)-dependent dehydrogenase, short-chain alcohol dehydrogenase family [Ferruginibacter sp.]